MHLEAEGEGSSGGLGGDVVERLARDAVVRRVPPRPSAGVCERERARESAREREIETQREREKERERELVRQ